MTDTTVVEPEVEVAASPVTAPVVAPEATPAADAPKTAKTLLGDPEGEGGTGELPEKYGFTPPDDLKDLVDPENIEAALAGFQDIAKSAGLTQEQFQKLVEFDTRRARDSISQQADQYTARVTEWADAAARDKEIGGDALPQNLALAKVGLDKVGDADLRSLLQAPGADNPEGLGLGNHPAVLRLFARVGKLFVEPDKLAKGGQAPVGSEEQLKRLYPSMYKDAS